MGFTLLRKVAIEPPEGLHCEYSLADRQDGMKPYVLVVSFTGDYPDGSRGNQHGHYIASMTLLGLSAFEPWCVVLDFREMSYRWGNTLLKVFQDVSQFMDAGNEPGEPSFPVIVVTSDKCRTGFLSLVTPSDGAEPSWHFDSIEGGLEAAFTMANEWIDA